jgi:acyl-CoA reductase-like NAD-dependent aldehyde dehydrogenase
LWASSSSYERGYNITGEVRLNHAGLPRVHATPAQRATLLRKAAALIRQHHARLSVVETLNSGKTLAEAEGDVRASARLFEYYSGAADKLQGETIPLDQNNLCYTTLEPIGVTAHILPWNYPTSTFVRGIAPALAAGCTVVAKPADTTPLTALMIAQLLHEAGIPAGVINIVTETGPDVGQALVEHEGVSQVTFTESVPTGRTVMQLAARNITPVVLELGGKSPLLILADADIDKAVSGALSAIFSNAGQICSAGSRLIVDRQLHSAIVSQLCARTAKLTLGHGLRNPDVGAIQSSMQLEKIASFIERARGRGISISQGGNITQDPETDKGYFFEPTIIDNVSTDDELIQSEIFGPVLCVQVADDDAHALQLANATPYGLMAGIYTQDISKALTLSRDIDSGQVTINNYWAGGVEVPFGGNKLSGFGREKGLAGLHNYTRIKATTVTF